MSFNGKVYAITGVASGIGRATAVRLAELGAAGLAISDVNEAALKETQALCPQSPHDVFQIMLADRGHKVADSRPGSPLQRST